MSRMKLTTLREMNDHDLEDKLLELKARSCKITVRRCERNIEKGEC